jgi:hypothetical protein
MDFLVHSYRKLCKNNYYLNIQMLHNFNWWKGRKYVYYLIQINSFIKVKSYLFIFCLLLRHILLSFYLIINKYEITLYSMFKHVNIKILLRLIYFNPFLWQISLQEVYQRQWLLSYFFLTSCVFGVLFLFLLTCVFWRSFLFLFFFVFVFL